MKITKQPAILLERLIAQQLAQFFLKLDFQCHLEKSAKHISCSNKGDFQFVIIICLMYVHSFKDNVLLAMGRSFVSSILIQ